MAFILLADATDNEAIQLYKSDQSSFRNYLAEAYKANRPNLIRYFKKEYATDICLLPLHYRSTPISLLQELAREYPGCLEQVDPLYYTDSPELAETEWTFEQLCAIYSRRQFFGVDRDEILQNLVEHFAAIPSTYHRWSELNQYLINLAIDREDFSELLMELYRYNYLLDRLSRYHEICYIYHRPDLMSIIHEHQTPVRLDRIAADHIYDMEFPLFNVIYQYRGDVNDIRTTNLHHVNRLLSVNWDFKLVNPQPRLIEIQQRLQMSASQYVFAMLIVDGYYTIKENDENTEACRFFAIMAQLPEVFQLLITGRRRVYSGSFMSRELGRSFYWM